MIQPTYQQIQVSEGGNSLLIRLYDLEKLEKYEIQEIKHIFKIGFADLPLNSLSLFINGTPLNGNLNSYVIYLKVNDNSGVYSTALGLNVSLGLSLTTFIVAFAEKLNAELNSEDFDSDMFNEDESNETDQVDNPNNSNLITEPINVDDILKDFEEEEKRKKDKDKEK